MQKYYVDSKKDLDRAIKAIQTQKLVAIDTEFTREKTYYPILSLIQIAVNNEIFAIDCMAKIDLRPLYDIVKDETVRKIFHSCSQDLQIFHQKSNEIAKNIEDIQTMANFCGIGYNIGYSGLVEEFKGIKLDKKMQRSDWQRRPLSPRQIEYAMLDVFYLEEIHQKLSQILKEKKREKWFLEEMKTVANSVAQGNEDALFRNFIRNKKIYKRNPQKLPKLKELIIWREKMAQEKNVPRQHFLSDSNLDRVVVDRDFSIKLAKRHLDAARDILDQDDKFKLDFELKSPIMDEVQKEKFQKARDLVERIANENELKPQFLIASQNLKDIILGKQKLAEALKGWRYFLVGRKLEKII